MQPFMKMRVPLSAVRPSGQNPREDFGDIDALAETIEATGGEPLNPPVLVADGNVYRIVDGERRYRALCSIYGADSDREVSALVTEGMDDANELVAMLATDDKRQLSEAERAHGVQQMLILGVDEAKAAKAARATEAQVRAVRCIGRVGAGVQPTLEQYERAARFEDEADREAVLSAGENWANRAWAIERRIEAETKDAADRAILDGEGIEVAEEAPEGWRVVSWVGKGRIAEEGIDPEWGEEFVIVGEADWWRVYAPAAEDAPSEEELAERADRERTRAALADLHLRAVRFFTAKARWDRTETDLLWGRARDERRVPWDCRRGLTDDQAVTLEEWVGDQVPARWELALAAIGAAAEMARFSGGWSYGPTPEGWLRSWDLLLRLGFEFGDEDRWVRDRVAADREAAE